jgi:tryptophan 2,3-dioxygenase
MTHDCYYGEYLQLDKILDAQSPRTPSAHDEHLFIVTHQTYELWFKQIIFEFRAMMPMMEPDKHHHLPYARIANRLERCKRILSCLVNQIDVLETMTSLEFLNFRDNLIPASGFQSVQFRMIEELLGYKVFKTCPGFNYRLKPKDITCLRHAHQEKDMHQAIQEWLIQLPYGQSKMDAFWKSYRSIVNSMFVKDNDIIDANQTLTDKEKEIECQMLLKNKQRFDQFFEDASEGCMALQAKRSALFIFLYQDHPYINPAFQLLQGLMDIEEQITLWRFRHYLMVQRMIGLKIGTGGSSGQAYLKRNLETHRVFHFFFDLASFLIPSQLLPDMPESYF